MFISYYMVSFNIFIFPRIIIYSSASNYPGIDRIIDLLVLYVAVGYGIYNGANGVRARCVINRLCSAVVLFIFWAFPP